LAASGPRDPDARNETRFSKARGDARHRTLRAGISRRYHHDASNARRHIETMCRSTVAQCRPSMGVNAVSEGRERPPNAFPVALAAIGSPVAPAGALVPAAPHEARGGDGMLYPAL